MKLRELFSEWFDLKQLAQGSLLLAVFIFLIAGRAYTRHEPKWFWIIAACAVALMIMQLFALYVIKKYKNNG